MKVLVATVWLVVKEWICRHVFVQCVRWLTKVLSYKGKRPWIWFAQTDYVITCFFFFYQKRKFSLIVMKFHSLLKLIAVISLTVWVLIFQFQTWTGQFIPAIQLTVFTFQGMPFLFLSFFFFLRCSKYT